MKILIVDDDPFLPRLLDIQLRNLRLKDRGFTGVTSFDRAKPAIELLANNDHDIGLLFCDLIMPEIDGIEFLKHLSDIGFRGGVVLLSGAGSATLKTALAVGKAYGLNMVASAEKPVPPDVLTDLLQAYRGDAAPAADIDPDGVRKVLALHQTRVVYQPIVDLATGRPVGFEALARMPVSVGRLGRPDHFLKVLRQEGELSTLDWQVLTRSASELPLIRELVADAFVSANVSADLVLGPDFPDRLAELLGTAGVPASALRLEIQEAELGPSPDPALLANLARLAIMGAGLTLDRFGNDGLQPETMNGMPFDEAKIRIGDQAGNAAAASSREVFNAVAVLAGSLGLSRTAVGVESPSQWQAAVESACARAQGFLVSPALSIIELTPWLADWTERQTPAVMART